jgi:hypothetical protein
MTSNCCKQNVNTKESVSRCVVTCNVSFFITVHKRCSLCPEVNLKLNTHLFDLTEDCEMVVSKTALELRITSLFSFNSQSRLTESSRISYLQLEVKVIDPLVAGLLKVTRHTTHKNSTFCPQNALVCLLLTQKQQQIFPCTESAACFYK